MLQLSKKKIIIYLLVLAFASVSMYGCNKEDAADNNTEETGDGGNVSDDAALDNAVANALNDNGEDAPSGDATESENPENNQDNPSEEPAKKAIADRSPVEITRIEVPKKVATGSGELVSNEKDPHEHEVTPNLFEIDDCQVEVNGIYQVKLAKDLLKAINTRRKDYGIGPLAQNTSLLACADSRCKEQTYFIGHFRPNGLPFNSVAYDYVQGECIAIDYRSVNDIMEAWFSVNDSRKQLMNPDYTQCGISIYDIDGIYYIAAVFGW
ncbi:MAG: CAP domain-containing protein [Lachnospiraceae bacterium]|nr:CAP domain-containing protein [Lachnospiraceae bacterium]